MKKLERSLAAALGVVAGEACLASAATIRAPRTMPTATASAAHAGVLLYVEVDDPEATLSRAVELGATSERGRTFLGTDDFWFVERARSTGISLRLWTSRAPPN